MASGIFAPAIIAVGSLTNLVVTLLTTSEVVFVTVLATSLFIVSVTVLVTVLTVLDTELVNSDVTFVTDFVIPHDQKVKVEFVFSYYSRCEDQGIILFSESATPMWDWGTVSNGLIGQWNCGYPVLGWSTGDTEPDMEASWPRVLEIGTAYLGVLEYDPNLPDSNLKLITKTYSGEVIDSVVVSGQLLPAGEDYKVGFSSDSDGTEVEEVSDGMSYFKNLKITIG